MELDPTRSYFRSSLVLALIAFLLAASAFILKLAYPESPVAYGYALAAFLAGAPLFHVVGMGYAVRDIAKGFGRLRGFGCLLLHVALIGLGILMGGIALIGASA